MHGASGPSRRTDFQPIRFKLSWIESQLFMGAITSQQQHNLEGELPEIKAQLMKLRAKDPQIQANLEPIIPVKMVDAGIRLDISFRRGLNLIYFMSPGRRWDMYPSQLDRLLREHKEDWYERYDARDHYR